MRGTRNRLLVVGVLVLLAGLLAQIGLQGLGSVSAPGAGPANAPMRAGVSGTGAGQAGNAVDAPAFEVIHSSKNDVSRPLRDIPPGQPEKWTTVREMPEPMGETSMNEAPAPKVVDNVVQSTFGPMTIPSTSANFDGVNNVDGVYPPDTNGDVGPNHYVQMVNLSFAIYDKAGNKLYGPARNNTLWSGFGGPCEAQNAGDPVVLYDSMSDRWLLSQFTSSSPYGECIAISRTGDPTGAYNRYFFQFSTSTFYDYPHLGVWPDGYYMAANRFGSVFFQGPAAIVFDRTKMLQGQPATAQAFNLSSSYGTLLPSDLDGSTLPPAGSPNFFMSRSSNALQLWKLHVDWSNTANSSLTGPTNLPVAAFNSLCSGTRSCVPQPGTTAGLDGLGDRLMFRLAYRNFADHESIVVSHSVDAGSGKAAVRWYEVRNPGTAPAVYQQGTFSPDATNRWLGSVAMDQQGNMAMVYSVASSSVYPSIRYTGRLAGDALGQMTQGEGTLINGSGSQTGNGYRWGDYASISLDPTDDCTFWMTTEYIQTTGTAPWRTRIGSFRYPGCGGVIPTPTATPIPPPPTATPVPPTPTATPSGGATFNLSASPASVTVRRGSSGASTITLTSVNGFAGTVGLSITGLPAKTSASFNPTSVVLGSGGSGSSTLTIAADTKGGTGTFNVTVTATGGGVTKTTPITLTITK